MGKKHPTNNPDNNTAPVAAGEDASASSDDASPEPGPAWPHGLTDKTVRARERLLASISKKDLALIIATSMDRDTFSDLCDKWGLL